MTGIDRLRELADRLDKPLRGGRELLIGMELVAIADQIEAEQEERITRRVAQDRDAAEWVREHGGLDAVRAEWRSRSNLKRMYEKEKAKVERQQRHIEFVQGKCRERQEHIVELNKMFDEMRPRLMPGGVEWLADAWPRFEDGEFVKLGDKGLDIRGDIRSVEGVEFTQGGFVFISDDMGRTWWANDQGPMEDPCIDPAKRVKRPAFLAADGEPLEVGQTVWHIDTGDEFHVSCFSDGTVNVSDKKGGGLQLFPSQLTHQRPVLVADGNRVETGMDVWWVCEGDERGIHAEKLHVEGIDEDGMVECSPYNGGTWVYLDPSELHVKKPVLDADGAPIHEGDTVYGIGRTQHVFVVLRQPGLGGGNGRFKIACHDVTDGVDCDCDPSLLTHTKPEPPESWERIEEDATKQPYAYCVERGLDDDALPTNEKFAQDLVRRCKALAERERWQ